MSFRSERIEYLLSRASKDQPRTNVLFARASAGDLEIVIVSEDRQLSTDNSVSEEDLGRHLAEEGIIRLPQRDQQTIQTFKRIDVGGKPMSEVIIEERR